MAAPLNAPPPDDVLHLPGSRARLNYYDKAHKYEMMRDGRDPVPVTGVTTIVNGTRPKPALPWWGMTIGVKGVCELYARSSGVNLADPDGLVKRLTAEKLTVNHVRDAAGDRGTLVHEAMDRWAADGTVPRAADFEVADRGFAQGMAKFLLDADPKIEHSEIMVYSPAHNYAGRYDARLGLYEPRELVVNAKTGKRAVIPAGLYLVDYKTGKKVYPEAHEQLAGYEGASLECGWPPTDGRAVVRFTPEGGYEWVSSTTPVEVFHAAAALYHLRAADKGAA